MTIETATYISDLNASNPGASDLKSEGDDHLRLIKSTVKATFPNVAGIVTPTHTQLNNFVAGSLGTSAVTTGAFALADAGLCVYATAGITAPNAVMAAGNMVTIVNTTASPITITQAASLTLRQAGTANTGNRTLAAYGIASILFQTTSLAFIGGTGVS